MTTKIALLAALGLVVLFGAGLGVGYVLFADNEPVQETVNINGPISVADTVETNENVNLALADETDVSPYEEEITVDEDIKPFPSEPVEGDDSVTDIPAMDIFDPVAEFNYGQYERENARFYSAGTVESGAYAGGEMVLLVFYPEGPVFYPTMARFVRDGDELTLLSLHSSGWLDILDDSKFTTDSQTLLPEYNYPAVLLGPDQRQILRLDTDVQAFFDPAGLEVAFTDETWGPVYRANGSNTAENIYAKNGFYLNAPDGTVRVYGLDVDFQDENDILNITWNNGERSYWAYSIGDVGGCGLQNYISVIDDGSVVIERDLVKTGTSNFGDVIYEYADSDAAFLHDWYENGYWGQWNDVTQDLEKDTYENYLVMHPFIFWVDPFDRLVRAMNSAFLPAAECGKPVIYLYPDKPTSVQVTVEPKGGFSYTDPAYNDGWQVTADADGRLWNSDGTVYPYLFWEGRGAALYDTPDRGFVVAQQDVDGFLSEKLTALGLRGREITDFKEFWLPRMQEKPWYFVTFLGNQAMETLAPLTVTPAPDTVIRVLMDFTALDAPISAEPYTIHTPERKGFTVIEWGGVLR
ncbi:MAG: hypothetical protein WCV86_04920 [Patescibacteria group bacterium]|jgi:hypothetical protein